MESNKKNYIAVTIGPIFDTMSLVSTPAALWISSYMFSCITKTICELLLDGGVKEEDIITPYFSKADTALLEKKDGVGMFHDRLIFVANDFDIKHFNQIKEKTLKKISELFELDLEYLKEYVQIAAVKYEAENPIFGCDSILNSRELEKPFVAKDSEHPLMKLLFSVDPVSGNQTEKNEKIKKIANKLSVFDHWQLRKGTDIKTLEMIVDPYYKTESQREAEKKKENQSVKAAKPAMKKHLYYAIVRSDGDNMSKIISSLNTDEDFRSFSKTCLSYCSAVADEVARFGGVTIYAGGDDLLAILPCENKNGDTPFEFIKSANKIFNEKFDSYHKPTSLSFGISMCYKKFPLYEALDDSAYLLFGVAKYKEYKNCSVIHLQKHAGQSEGLLISNSALDELLSLKDVVVKSGASEDEEERIIISVLHKLSLFEHLLSAMDDDREAVFTLFKNMFDSGEQQTTFLHKKLPDFYHKLKTDVGIRALTDDGVQSNPVTAAAYVLRVLKFFNEKAGDRE